MHLLIYGFGFTGRALAARLPERWSVAGTSRTAQGRDAVAGEGVQPIDPEDAASLHAAVARADAVLISAPPDAQGCPGLAALAPVLEALPRRSRWIGYLSTTGVYGDRGGGWVFEDSPLLPLSPEGERRAKAEADWRAFGGRIGAEVNAFRLPGIYGPGRSALDRVQAGEARRVIKPGHVFSRIHVDDLAAALQACLDRPGPGRTYNICDDEPCAAAEVTTYAADLLGVAPPPAQAFDANSLSPMARRFWAESKRISNARAKAVLGWRPAYPSYREGLAAVLAAERA
ncbi:MAG: SDR family oxidoreductase [Caulobacteraceae bacterium]